MGTAIVKRGMHSTSTPTSYGWAVPNWTYNEHQYAPGPMPAPAWPVSDYSVFGRSADYGTVDFLQRRMVPGVPNWALLAGGAILLYTMKDGKKMPFRKNPYGVPLLGVPLLGGAAIVLGTGYAFKSLGSIGDAFSGMSGAGLFLGLSLGILYALKAKESKAAYGMGGALAGWGVGMAYEKSQEQDAEAGLVTKTWDFLI